MRGRATKFAVAAAPSVRIAVCRGALGLQPWLVAELRDRLVEQTRELGVELLLVGCEVQVVGAEAKGVLQLGGRLVERRVAEAGEEGEESNEELSADERGDAHRGDHDEDPQQKQIDL